MNDQDMHDFEVELENLMQQSQFGKPSIHEQGDELMQIAQQLVTTDLSNRSQIRSQLYHKLSRQANSLNNGGKFITMNTNIRRLAASVATVLVLALSIPVVTVLAQTILAQVGQHIVTDEQESFAVGDGTTVADMEATPAPFSEAVREAIQTAPHTIVDGTIATYLNIADATTMTGFDVVREPSYLPNGYAFGGRIVFSNAGNTTVDSHWQAGGEHFSLSQSEGNIQNTFRVGTQAQLHDVEVNGLPATLITNANLNHSDGRFFTLLMWQEAGYTYVLSSPSLSQADMQAIAESLYR